MFKKSLVIGGFVVLSNINFSLSKEVSFSQKAWEENKGIYHEILELPFNKELSEGTLDKKKYDFYKNQDAFYLRNFSKALSTFAAKLDNIKDIKNVLRFASNSFDENLSHIEIGLEGISPSNFSYIHFLLSTASFGTKEELSAALLPCFWIYLEVGKELKKKSSKENPYNSWIDLYSSNKYETDVKQMIELTDRLAKKATSKIRKKMLTAFKIATKLEYEFWNDSYHKRELLK